MKLVYKYETLNLVKFEIPIKCDIQTWKLNLWLKKNIKDEVKYL